MSARRLLCWVFVMVVGVLVFASAPALAAASVVAIEGESSSDVSATEARLEATINPGGSEASYHFEYGTATGSYEARVPATDLEIPAGEVGVGVNVVLTHLTPGTTYHYRVVASNAQPGVVDGADESFTTPAAHGSGSPSPCPNEQLRAEQPYGLGLPDCRAYEMVSPLETLGNDAVDSFIQSYARASVSGEAVTYASEGVFANPIGTTGEDQFVSRRGPEGWSTQSITPPHDPTEAEINRSYETEDFTPELTEGVANTNAALTSASPGGGIEQVYLDDFGDDSYQYLGEVENIAGSSTDLSHLVFNGSEFGTVHEWVDGKLVTPSVANDSESISTVVAGKDAGILTATGGDVGLHAMSADGSRVYMEGAKGRLYLRENAEQPQSLMDGEVCVNPSDACTIEVSASQKTDGSGPKGIDLNEGSVHYWGASVSGSKVFFSSDQELTNNANTGVSDKQEVAVEHASGGTYTLTFKGQTTVPIPFGADAEEVQSALESLSSIGVGNVVVSASSPVNYLITFENALAGSEQPVLTADGSSLTTGGAVVVNVLARPGNDLYEYDLETGKLTDVSADALATDGAQVLGVAQISEEGSYVYFVAEGALAGNAVSGEPNLYVSREGGAPVFIATLTAYDESDWNVGDGPTANTAVATPSGNQLAFISEGDLTGYDNEQAEPGDCEAEILFQHSLVNETGKCREIYIYNTGTNKLLCASCNPSGQRPTGPSSFVPLDVTIAQLPLSLYRPRNLIEGGTLFFDSSDELVPHTSDGRVNVYEYEDGHVYAISDVAGGFESFFLDASPDGNNVFFGTADQLLPQDVSNNVVVYDARADGGFPVTVAPPSCNNGDSCKPPPAAQPGVFGAPGSATFSGPGNIAPVPVTSVVKAKAKATKCRKGYEKKNGKCVKKRKSKKRSGKSSDRRGSK